MMSNFTVEERNLASKLCCMGTEAANKLCDKEVKNFYGWDVTNEPQKHAWYVIAKYVIDNGFTPPVKKKLLVCRR